MCDEPDPFVFPELPDEAAAALDHFLEDFYNSFQQRYGINCTATIAQSRSARPTTVRCPIHRYRTHRSESPKMTAAPAPRSRSLMAHHRS